MNTHTFTPIQRQPISSYSVQTLWSQVRNARATARRRRLSGRSVFVPVDYTINGGEVRQGHVVKAKHAHEVDAVHGDTRQVPSGFVCSVRGGNLHFDVNGRAETPREPVNPEGCTQCQGCSMCDWCGKDVSRRVNVYQLLEPLTAQQAEYEAARLVLRGEADIASLSDEQLGALVRSGMSPARRAAVLDLIAEGMAVQQHDRQIEDTERAQI